MIRPFIGLAMMGFALFWLEAPPPFWLFFIGYWLYTANDAQGRKP